MILVLNFSLFDKHEYIDGIFQSVILVSRFTLQAYITISLLIQIWLTESVLIFTENLFRKTCFLSTCNNQRYKFSSMKIRSLPWNGSVYICKEKLWQKVTSSIKCHNFHSFKVVILLWQSIYERRGISHLAQLSLQFLYFLRI